MKKIEKDEIIIKEETAAEVVVFVLLFFFIALAMIVVGLAKKGPSYFTLIELVVITVLGYIAFMFYKNYRCYLVIDNSGVSCFETKGLSTKINRKWDFLFDEYIEIRLTKGVVPLGARGNTQECFHITAYTKNMQYSSKSFVARLDSFKNQIPMFREKEPVLERKERSDCSRAPYRACRDKVVRSVDRANCSLSQEKKFDG